MMCFAAAEKSSESKSQLNPFAKSLLSAPSNPGSNLLCFLEHDRKHGTSDELTLIFGKAERSGRRTFRN